MKAEAKILFIMCYYIILGTLVLTAHTYFQVAGETATRAVYMHFACQSTGLQSDRDCGAVPSIYLAAFNALSDLGIVLLGLLPVVVLMFTVKCNRNNKC